MFTTTLLLVTGFFFANPATSAAPVGATVLELPLGGPPSIRIAGKASGGISSSEWATVKSVQLAGCASSAQVVEVAVCIKDCTGKNAELRIKGDEFSSGMRSMIANLPAGTPFTVSVKVVDGGHKELKVPPAQFVWKG